MCRLRVFLIIFIFEACQPPSDNISHAENTGYWKNTTGTSTKPDAVYLFRKHCTLCHGADGKLGLNGAKDLTVSQRPLAERIELIKQGKNLMPSFEKTLTPVEIEAVARYTLSLSPNPEQ
jgi:cytochrome c6